MFPSDATNCALSVDLYDTTTDQDIVITQELTKEGLAWPQYLTPEVQEKMFVKYEVSSVYKVYSITVYTLEEK